MCQRRECSSEHQPRKHMKLLASRIAEGWIDQVAERSAGEEALQIFDEQLERAVEVAWRRSGSVWGDDDVRYRPKRARGWDRLARRDIERRPRDPSSAERIDEGVLVDDRAAGDVHEVRGGSH